MKTLFYKNNKVVIEELPVPKCGAGEVLVANAFSVVSIGSETFSISESSARAKAGKRENVKKAFEFLKTKGVGKTLRAIIHALGSERPLGYTSAGYVLEVGRNIKDLKRGERVACVGMEKAVHGEIIAVPRNLVAKVSESVDLRYAAFGAIGSIALNAVRKLNPQIGENVVVYGTGLIGLMTLLVLKLTGAKTICFDLSEPRLVKAKELGADDVFLVGDARAEKELEYITSGRGVDAVIIAAASNNPEIINSALHFLRPGGKIVLLGKTPINIDYNLAFRKDIAFLISRSYGPGRYDMRYEEQGIDYPFEYVRWTEGRNLEAFLDLIAQKKLDIKALISEEISLEEAPNFYRKLQSGSKKYLGVLIAYKPEHFTNIKNAEYKIFVSTPRPPIPGRIKAGIIGVGDFAKGMLLPTLSDLKDFYEIIAIAGRKPYDLKQIARNYKVSYIATGADELINDEGIDLVFITTPNSTHKEFIAKCAAKNRACFVEKPLCITLKEYQELENTYLKNSQPAPLFVGFNRRFAPLALKAKEILDSLSGPMIIHCAVNAGFMESTNWMQDIAVGGGRLVSEGCHFVDFGYFLTGSDVKAKHIEYITPNNHNIRNLDNYLISLKFGDDSLMSINYNSIGPKSYPKEHIQIFKNGFVVEIVDFRKLRVYSPEEVKEAKLSYVDKGHKQQYLEVAKYLKGESNSISPLSRVFASSKTTLELNEKIYEKQ